MKKMRELMTVLNEAYMASGAIKMLYGLRNAVPQVKDNMDNLAKMLQTPVDEKSKNKVLRQIQLCKADIARMNEVMVQLGSICDMLEGKVKEL